MKSIGEFARQNNVTIKALHHYEKLGLITPAKIDDFTGYRYYEESQSARLEAIVYFKSLGFSLSETGVLLAGDMGRDALLRRLESKREQALVDVSSAEGRLGRLTALIDCLDRIRSGEKLDLEELMMMNHEDTVKHMNGHERFHYTAKCMYDEALEKGKPLCTMCIDIDGMKTVNDLYGHNAGDVYIDRIMTAMADVLTDAGQDGGGSHSMLERAGGDEFHAIVREDAENCMAIGRRMIESVRAIDFDDVQPGLKGSISVGVASIESKPMSCSHLFHLADSALYELKMGERGTVKLYRD